MLSLAAAVNSASKEASVAGRPGRHQAQGEGAIGRHPLVQALALAALRRLSGGELAAGDHGDRVHVSGDRMRDGQQVLERQSQNHAQTAFGFVELSQRGLSHRCLKVDLRHLVVLGDMLHVPIPSDHIDEA